MYTLGGLETAAIAGIVAAVVVLILLAGVAAFFVMKKKQKTKAPVTPVNNTTSGVSTIPNVGWVNPTPVTDSENSQAA